MFVRKVVLFVVMADGIRSEVKKLRRNSLKLEQSAVKSSIVPPLNLEDDSSEEEDDVYDEPDTILSPRPTAPKYLITLVIRSNVDQEVAVS